MSGFDRMLWPTGKLLPGIAEHHAFLRLPLGDSSHEYRSAKRHARCGGRCLCASCGREFDSITHEPAQPGLAHLRPPVAA